MKKYSYAERAVLAKNPLAKKLFLLMEKKQSNLAFSADVTDAKKLLELADQLGPEICILKTHIDIVTDFTPALTESLKALAKQHQFLIFEDRKFADIGHTVQLQYQQGIYRIADWADIVNAHSLPGPDIIRALTDRHTKEPRGLLLLANMSSKGCLCDDDYVQQTIQMAQDFPDAVMGFIAPQKISAHPEWIHLTPGIQFHQSGDTLGQQYVTPEIAIRKRGTDIIIVGRGILQADDPLMAAKQYRAAGWEAYHLL
ncbi:MAG: orotidine-5'-phosphate decarboxylase [Gammaproteobacteria bacterium]|nr:orotidine-5'-phosphate decarboxylase [Gammaproteobacteria bacterium]